jgi:hypothetical protein
MKITKKKTRKEKAAERVASLRAYAKGRLDEDGTRFRLVLKQDPATGMTEPCLFCGESHLHGVANGHCVVHCFEHHVFVNDRGELFDSMDGYEIEVADKANRVDDDARPDGRSGTGKLLDDG